ncbi:MAG: hypothetical protein ACO394_02915 [Blastocatellia bacterium]
MAKAHARTPFGESRVGKGRETAGPVGFPGGPGWGKDIMTS